LPGLQNTLFDDGRDGGEDGIDQVTSRSSGFAGTLITPSRRADTTSITGPHEATPEWTQPPGPEIRQRKFPLRYPIRVMLEHGFGIKTRLF
jgi:hypothetical protein